jgi:hypothetical protein
LPDTVPDQLDAHGAARKERLEQGRHVRLPGAGETLLVFAAVPFAPLGDGCLLARLLGALSA